MKNLSSRDSDNLIIEAEAELNRHLEIAHASEGALADVAIDKAIELDDFIATTPAASVKGAIVQMRRILDPDLGIAIGSGEHDLSTLNSVFGVLESLKPS